MKEYLLLIRKDEQNSPRLSDEKHQEFIEKCMVYINDLKKEGKLIGAQPLEEVGKKISRPKSAWKDGPFNETKEVVAGYYHVQASDLDEAIAIAKRNPEFEYNPTASIEVRQIKTKEKSTGFIYPSA